jgi:AcrR family transcriptional regulator
MTKGEETRAAIVDQALRMASISGLEALSIGDLAGALNLSKSGLFAHFRSKENLQLEVIRAAAERFVQLVMVPAFRQPRGEPRVRALFEGWLHWALESRSELPGGCIFIGAAAELDDQPGPVRDALVKAQRDWLDTLAHAAHLAVEEGHFRKNLDTQQFAFELYALMLGGHHYARLLRDPRAVRRTRAAYNNLVATAR